ncbi:MAG: hypothetical protein COA78_17775 [Blastopirellula sp.]|nr:MAG: hypothetical protein COA78_17775 [Blastopirellula sp.]
MIHRNDKKVYPRNGHTLFAGIAARISGCASQKEASLEDQIDHAKEEIAEIYDGPVEFFIISTIGKGEQLDRPELAKIEKMLRKGELDFFVMEDAGRLVRGTKAVDLWGIAVDHGIRCIAPNDCLDTINETWEEELISACRDHVGHNAHTSKRLKKKLMNRFVKHGGATAREISGYLKPEGAKTYDEWEKIESATEVIQQGAELLLRTLNCSTVADVFNEKGFPVGKYCRTREEWDGKYLRSFYANTLLKGMPARGSRHTVKHHETGHRKSEKNKAGPNYYPCPHLAHLDAATFDELNAALVANNSNRGRKSVNGKDPRYRVPRSRTQFPSQHARCYYCGRHMIRGGNGIKENLMCSGAREWKCWNSIGFNGAKMTQLTVDAVQHDLYALEGFDEQFAQMVRGWGPELNGDRDQKWKEFQLKEKLFLRDKENLESSLRQFGARKMIVEQLDQLEKEEQALAMERQSLEHSSTNELDLPTNVNELKALFDEQLLDLSIHSTEMADLLNFIVPEVYIYLVRLCDGGNLLPRAKVKLNLMGIVPDAQFEPSLNNVLTRELTIDLFDPTQRERIRKESVQLVQKGLTHKQIANAIEEKPTATAVYKALKLEAKMKELGLTDPYIFLNEPPEDYKKLRRHKNKRYQFQMLDNYQPPEL